MPRKYITQHIGGKGYTSPLHKFIDFTGRSYGTMTRKEIDKVGKLRQYKLWKKLQRTKRMLKDQHKIEEAKSNSNLDVGEFSKKYKHIDPTHVQKKKAIINLLSKGFSPEKQSITATKQTKFGRAKPRIGRRAYQPIRKGYVRFREITFDPKKKGRSITARLLTKHKEYKGKTARIFADYELDTNKAMLESQPMTYDEKVDRTTSDNKINRLVQINKKQKSQEIFKPKKTLTGKSISDTNEIEINPQHNNEILKTQKS
jgi:hypothetical protein